jgi:PleD family two-component response regulator
MRMSFFTESTPRTPRQIGPQSEQANAARRFGSVRQRTVPRSAPCDRSSAMSADPARSKLLYVEEDADCVALAEQILAARPDVLLLRAADASNAIRLARSARPDVVLLNTDLCRTSPLQFMKLLRALPSAQSTPILALGADPAPGTIVKMIEAGFFSYLVKPLHAVAFTEALSDAREFAARERAEENDMPLPSVHGH